MPKLKEIGLLVENVNARDYVPLVQAAERLGFNSFWVPEDYAFPGAFSSATAIAAVTSKIKIGTGVINPFPSRVTPCSLRWSWPRSISSPVGGPSFESGSTEAVSYATALHIVIFTLR